MVDSVGCEEGLAAFHARKLADPEAQGPRGGQSVINTPLAVMPADGPRGGDRVVSRFRYTSPDAFSGLGSPSDPIVPARERSPGGDPGVGRSWEPNKIVLLTPSHKAEPKETWYPSRMTLIVCLLILVLASSSIIWLWLQVGNTDVSIACETCVVFVSPYANTHK